MTDSTGAITDRYAYDAFGNILSQAGTTPNVYLYSGEQNDPNLSLYYLRARYLSPTTGRFWTADRFNGTPADPLSLHKYVYANANPINRSDPSGNISLPELTLSIYIRFSVLVFPAVNYVNSNVISSLLGQSLAPALSEAEGFAAAGQWDRLLQLAGRISTTSIPEGPAVFYGAERFDEAAAFARTEGLKLLNDYPPGRLFDQIRTVAGIPQSVLDEVGQIISSQYAARAAGPVHIFLPVLMNNPLRGGFSSNLYGVEFPALAINSSVTEYIIHFADGTVRTLSPALFESFALGGSLN